MSRWASSSTSISTSSNVNPFVFYKWSISLPGVATMKSGAWSRSLFCEAKDEPPNTGSDEKPERYFDKITSMLWH